MDLNELRAQLEQILGSPRSTTVALMRDTHDLMVAGAVLRVHGKGELAAQVEAVALLVNDSAPEEDGPFPEWMHPSNNPAQPPEEER